MPSEHRKITAEDQDRVLRRPLERAQKLVRITPGQRRTILNHINVTMPKNAPESAPGVYDAMAVQGWQEPALIIVRKDEWERLTGLERRIRDALGFDGSSDAAP